MFVSRLSIIVVSIVITISAPSTGFLTRTNSTLFSNGKAVRFGGINAYWLGLDENEGGIAYPTQYRITDAMTTISGWLGPTLVRSHSIGISTGNPLSYEPSLGVFNETALLSADRAIAEAERLGLRLIIPLTDNWKYYHGGKHDFTDWLNLPESSFYTDSRAIAAFQDYISHRLHHINPYTGRATRDEPAIAFWETGNELDSPTVWVETIATFIKSIDSNHLVLDGNNPLDTSHLTISSIDAVSSHYYPPNTAKLISDAAAALTAQKVFSAGEFGWDQGNNPERDTMMAACLSAPACANAAPWSLFPHADTFGFVNHNDGFTIHYPGLETLDQTYFVSDMTIFATSMYGIAPNLPSPSIPSVFIFNSTYIAWKGAALAATYTVQIANQETGPWQTISPSPGPRDIDLPWKVVGGIKSGQWIRVQAIGISSELGEWSTPIQK